MANAKSPLGFIVIEFGSVSVLAHTHYYTNYKPLSEPLGHSSQQA